MTTLTPPPERDVPAAVRARVLGGIDAAPRRNWIPVAAAVAAVVALVVPVVVLTRDTRADAPPPATGGAVPPWTAPRGFGENALPDAQFLAARCRDSVPDAGRYADRDVVVRAVYADAAGYVAWVGGDGLSAVCGFDWTDGRQQFTTGVVDGEQEPTWAPDSGPGLSVLRTDGGEVVTGVVARGVTKVELRRGALRTSAAVHGPYFVARLSGARVHGAGGTTTATAYDQDGTAREPVDVLRSGTAPDLSDRIRFPEAPPEPVQVSQEQVTAALRKCGLDLPYARLVTTVGSGRGFLSLVTNGEQIAVCGWKSDGSAENLTGTVDPGTGVSRPISEPVTFFSAAGRDVLAGKVAAGVRKVTLTFADGRTLRAAVTDGVWIAEVHLDRVEFYDGRVDHVDTDLLPYGYVAVPYPVLRAYGEGDRLLYDSSKGGDVSCPQGDGKCSYPWP